MEKSDLDKYLKLTGQSLQDLMAGANQVGMDENLRQRVPRALKENKKIVWIVENEELATGEYQLQDP